MAVVPFGRGRSRDPRWRRWVQASVACGLAVATTQTASASDPLFGALAVTHVRGEVQAPPFELATTDGKTLALASFKGSAVLVNFWATWCPPCREEMPSMERLYQALKAEGLVLVAVNIQESPKQVARFMRDFRLTFPALLDADGAVAARYGVRGLPSTYLVDRAGLLVGQVIGPRDWADEPARSLLRSLLAPARR